MTVNPFADPPPTEPPRWAMMWALAFAIYAALKLLTWWRGPRGASVGRQLGYLLAWPGMDAVAFLSPPIVVNKPSAGEWLFAAAKFLFGVITTTAAGRLPADVPAYVVGWVGMVGIAFVLHFGLFHLLSCLWRSNGVDAKPLMHWPALATSVSDYWGRRWNTAFSDLTRRFLFRPLAPRLGAAGALWVGFVASGLVHDAVVSLPAGGGVGCPTLFFLIQAAIIGAERSRPGRRLVKAGWGRPLTVAAILLPAPLLFHGPFVVGVIVPFVQALGGVR